MNKTSNFILTLFHLIPRQDYTTDTRLLINCKKSLIETYLPLISRLERNKLIKKAKMKLKAFDRKYTVECGFTTKIYDW